MILIQFVLCFYPSWMTSYGDAVCVFLDVKNDALNGLGIDSFYVADVSYFKPPCPTGFDSADGAALPNIVGR